jgi:pimeloyl-ACP methyl ester carboxylesterase
MATARTPVVFIHGLWLHAQCWKNWVERFREAGYDPTAPSWPGVPGTVAEARAHPEGIARQGITEVAEHYAGVIRSLSAKPIVIGHSFGGLMAQNLLGRGLAAAAIAIDPAPIKGVLPLPLSALRVASVALKNPANWSRAVALSAEEFRYGFGNALTAEESADLFQRWTIPSPGRPLFQVAVANFAPHSAAKVDTSNATRGPLLLTAGGKDHTVPPVMVRATLALYRKSAAVTELKEFPDRGHSLTVDGGWREIADAALGWLKGRSLT